jgi:hypothetical protein
MSPPKKSPSKTAAPGRKKRSAAKRPDTAARKGNDMNAYHPQKYTGTTSSPPEELMYPAGIAPTALTPAEVDPAAAETADQEANARVARETKAPPIQYDIPPGLSPNQIIALAQVGALQPLSPTEPEPSEPPPDPPATETGVLNMAMNDSTDSLVALADKTLTATVGDVLLVDSEYMKITDASDLNNLLVTRAACGSVIGVHEIGAPVSIWGTAPQE